MVGDEWPMRRPTTLESPIITSVYISSTVGAAAIGVGGVIVGASLQALQQWANRRSHRRELADDRLWAARREAYGAFLVALGNSAHVAGALAPRDGRQVPHGAEAREHADYYFDQSVTPALRAVQIVATPDAAIRAAEAAAAFADFRDRMTHPSEPPPRYRSPEYSACYEPARRARDRFQGQAVRDLAVE